MTSILTNGAAISALQTLRSVSSNLDATQRMVSSGMRFQYAADNAAYWSVSTTMRSDGMAISAVSDALGLGAAKVDVAYAGMSSVIDVLHEFKAKLVAAKEDGVDKAKIQTELEQLKEQVVSISTSASFSGQNWLNTDVPSLDNVTKSVVSSFVRSESGAVSVNTASIEMARTSLFNTTGGGLLQRGIPDVVTLPPSGGLDLGGLISGAPSTHAHRGHTYFDFVAGSPLSSTDIITFDVTVDSSTFSGGEHFTGITIDQALVNTVLGKSDGSIVSADEYAMVIHAALNAAGVPAGSDNGGYGTNAGVVGTNTVDIGSDELTAHPGSSVVISNLVSSLPGNFAFGLNPANIYQHMNLYASAYLNFTEGFQVDTTGSITLDVTFSGEAPQSFTISKADVDAALGTSDGIVKTSADMAKVFNDGLGASGLRFSGSGAGLSITANSAVRPQQGTKSDFVISNITSTGVTAVSGEVTTEREPDFDFLDIDIVANADIDHYIDGLEVMYGRVVDGASVLGALSKRIEMQTEFATRMMATVDKGIGRLVDADMNEASTRLKALQTQQQLAIQSLSIANTSAENMMQLFR